MTKDYYKILGITEFESAENIKTAYRKLARKWHPDVAGNSEDVIKHFKDINEAYEILSNKIKKEEYDKARKFYNYAKSESKEYKKENNNSSTNPQNKGFNFNWEDFIKKTKTESYKKEENNIPIKGEDIYSDIEISVFEAVNGTVKTVNMLQTKICPKCKGRKFVNGCQCSNCKGKGEFSEYKKFNVKIPAGIKNNSKIRLAGEGSQGLFGGRNGDLYITIHIKETSNYKTDGLNILKTIPIEPFEAVLGTTVKICTLKGNLSVKIAPNTQNGQKIRIAGCGIVQNELIGDMILIVEIRIPKQLTTEEINLYKKLEELSSKNIRENLYD